MTVRLWEPEATACYVGACRLRLAHRGPHRDRNNAPLRPGANRCNERGCTAPKAPARDVCDYHDIPF